MLVLAGLTIVQLCLSASQVLMCWLAPKYFVIQKILELTK